jgi:hypothetical protein
MSQGTGSKINLFFVIPFFVLVGREEENEFNNFPNVVIDGNNFYNKNNSCCFPGMSVLQSSDDQQGRNKYLRYCIQLVLIV